MNSGSMKSLRASLFLKWAEKERVNLLHLLIVKVQEDLKEISQPSEPWHQRKGKEVKKARIILTVKRKRQRKRRKNFLHAAFT